MANSRKSRNRNDRGPVVDSFERALGEIGARVSASSAAADKPFALGIGYSGGLDSTVLLQLAVEYARQHQIRIEALHVHHGLSPHAEDWTAHCTRVCQQLEVGLHVARISVAGGGQGIEAAARVARYAALGQFCDAQRLPVLLTAHHQDDQTETVLLQLLRGAGVAGLSGMGDGERRPELLGTNVLLARPLLTLRRAELEAFASERGLQWVTDESNQDTRYRRNALRHNVLPVLERAFPGSGRAIARSARHMQSAHTLLNDLARIDRAACSGRDADALEVAAVRQLSDVRADNLLRFWLAQQGVPMPATAQLDQLRCQMLHAGADHQPVVAFGAAEVRRIAGQLLVMPRTQAGSPEAVELSWRGETVIEVPSWHGRLAFQPGSGPAVPETMLRNAVLSLRPRQGSERLKLAQNRPSRTLKNLFQEAAVPVWRRSSLPLIFLDQQLLAIGGIGTDCRMLVDQPGFTIEWQPDQPRR